jgi:hypothetical protein
VCDNINFKKIKGAGTPRAIERHKYARTIERLPHSSFTYHTVFQKSSKAVLHRKF